MRRIIVVFAFITCCSGICKRIVEWRECIIVRNKSDQSVAFLVSMVYPDTSIPKSILKGMPAGESEHCFSSRDSWSQVFKSLPKDTLTVFFFSNDTIIKYGWDEVRSSYRILKRYDLSRKDLERTNYTVVYP